MNAHRGKNSLFNKPCWENYVYPHTKEWDWTLVTTDNNQLKMNLNMRLNS